MEKRCQMPHVVQTNENANKFKTIEKAPSPTPPPKKTKKTKNYIASTFAICKEIKKKYGLYLYCV